MSWADVAAYEWGIILLFVLGLAVYELVSLRREQRRDARRDRRQAG